MKNRIPTYAGRIKLIPVEGEENTFDMVRADEPVEEGTPLNKRLLDFAVAANGVTTGTGTAYALDDEFGGFVLSDGAKINFKLHADSGDSPTINVNKTGAKPLMVTPTIPMTKGASAGTWHTAVYNADYDCFILSGNGSTMTSLWENPNPTEAFGAQSLAIDTVSYSRFLVIFGTTDGSYLLTGHIPYFIEGSDTYFTVQYVLERSSSAFALFERQFGVNKAGEFYVKACDNNAQLIPLRIYGMG